MLGRRHGEAVLLGVVPAFGWLASRVPRLRLITITTVFCALNLAGFYLAGRAGARLAAPFYIWLGVFNVFVVAQFWSFANDIYTEGQGRRALSVRRRRGLAGAHGWARRAWPRWSAASAFTPSR